jgi:FkbM family methyltransferase
MTMLRVLRQLSNDITSAIAMVRRRYLYTFRAGRVGNNTGVISDMVRLGRLQCEISFRYKSLGDVRVVDQIFQHQEYGLEETGPHSKALKNYYDSVLASGRKPLILDAGANIGASSLYFSCTYPESVIVAVEPERNNCALLKRNAQGKPIHVIEAAIGAEPGTIYLQDPGLSDWGFRTADSGDYSVPLVSPHGILGEYGEDRYSPLLFKIDIEGFEEQLFSSNLQWVDKFPMIAIELHDWMLPGRGSSRSFLRAMGSRDFDFLHAGENVFCFNNRLLSLGSAA